MWERDQLRRLESDETWGVEVTRVGRRAEGRLREPYFDPRERLEASIRALEDAADVGDRHRRLDAALDELERAGTHPIWIQAHYASRALGDKAGTLDLVAYFRVDGSQLNGTLIDDSQLVPVEQVRYTRSAASYEQLMEQLFDDVARAYPAGSLSFAFQLYDGTRPTDRFVRLTRTP